jgi:uncharacterized phiE125 gp8 family phage protein
MPTRIITPPVAYPLHLCDVKQHLREDLTENDGLIEVYLAQSIESAFAVTGRQLVAARFQKVFDCLPCQLELDVAPLIQVVGVQYLDGNSQWQTVPATDYVVEASFKPRITHTLGIQWPTPQEQIGSVQVTFDAGYVAFAEFDSAANTMRLHNWKALQVGDVLRLRNSGGVLPQPLKPKANYYVQSVVAADTYTLSATAGGPAITLLDNGAGWHYAGQIGAAGTEGEIPGGILAYLLMETETLYSYRGGLINTPASTLNENPFRKHLLDPYRLSYL